MSTPGPDDSPPQSPDELGGLDPKDLFNAGLETVPPVTLPPQPVDPDATVRVTPSSTGIKLEARQELPLPEELTALLPGGNYHVESFLGQGGMGAVYKGTQVRLKRPVAIKIMRRDFGKDHDFEARFEREAQAMAKLNHPNIVSVIDFGEAGPDYLYIVMELVDGADMMDVIRTGRMTQEMALTLLPQICDALQFAHDHGIVHRDIKPSNIMLTRDGRIKMADFGLAKRYDVESSFRTQTGTGMGTPDYAAPEQFDPHAQIDHRADIYALGVMIYQMITGQLPRGVWKPPSQRAEVAPQWDDIVGRAMQSDPADRYQKATEVKTDVSSISLGAVAGVCDPGGGKPSSAKSTPKPSAPPPASQRPATTKSRAPLLVGIAASALVLGIVAFFALQKKPSSGRLEPATSSLTSSASKSAEDQSTPVAKASGEGLKPDTALAAAPLALTPIAEAALPESGWKPLFTETEWHLPHKTTRKQADGSTVPAGRSFEDGLMHVQQNAFVKPQPTTDVAIRARIVIQPGTDTAAVVARRSGADGFYKWGTTPNDRVLVLIHFKSSTNTSTTLGRHELPAPLRSGDKLELELRVQGNRLTALANGAVVIDTQDDRLKAAGECGIDAHNGSFESVEVQPLPAAATPTPIAATQLPEAGWKPLFTDAYWRASNDKREIKDGLLHLKQTGATTPHASADGAIRARFQLRSTNDRPKITARSSATEKYQLMLGAFELWLEAVKPGAGHIVISKVPLPRVPKAGDAYLMELRIQGDRLVGLLNGVLLIEATDASVTQAGEWGIYGDDAWFESVEVQPLPAAAVSPSPNLPVSKSSDPKFPPGQWVKLFTKPEDLPADLRKPDSGVRWEDGWIKHGGTNPKAIPLPSQLAGNYGFRARFRRGAQGANYAAIDMRSQSATANFYRISFDASGWLRVGRTAGGSVTTVCSSEKALPVAEGTEYTLEAGVVARRLVGRYGSSSVISGIDDRFSEGRSFVNGFEDVRDIEVINLDGLPEAEALRLLGVDEKGNDLRMKAGTGK